MNDNLFEVTITGEVNRIYETDIERYEALFAAGIIIAADKEDDCYTLTVKKRMHANDALQAVGKVSNMVLGIFWRTSWRTAEISCVEASVEEAAGV